MTDKPLYPWLIDFDAEEIIASLLGDQRLLVKEEYKFFKKLSEDVKQDPYLRLKCHIILSRRNEQVNQPNSPYATNEYNMDNFRELIEEYWDMFDENISSRWKISILNTFVTHGNDKEKIGAFVMVTIFCWEQLHERTKGKPRSKMMMDDIPITWKYEGDDTYFNYFRRLKENLDPLIEPIATGLLKKALNHKDMLFQNSEHKRDLIKDAKEIIPDMRGLRRRK